MPLYAIDFISVAILPRLLLTSFVQGKMQQSRLELVQLDELPLSLDLLLQLEASSSSSRELPLPPTDPNTHSPDLASLATSVGKGTKT